MNWFKFAGFFFILNLAATQIFSADNLHDRVLRYDFSRVRTTAACKSLIIDYIKAAKFDSIHQVIACGDSVNSPDTSWLSHMSRFLIRLIECDIDFLSQPSTYKNYFRMTLIRPADKYYQYYLPYFSDSELVSHPVFFLPDSTFPLREENITRFLYSFAKEKINTFQLTHSQHSDLWDFLINFALSTNRNRDDLSTEAIRFLKKYPNSIFKELVLYNFTYRFERGSNAKIMGIIGGYDLFGEKTKQLIPNHFSLGMFFKMKTRRLFFLLCAKTGGFHTASTLNYGQDTLRINTELDINRILFGIGHPFFWKKRVIISPYLGFHLLQPALSQSKGKKGEFQFPNTTGFCFGLSVDLTRQFKDFNFEPEISLNIGISNTRMSKIRGDLSSQYYFIELGFGLIDFDRKRVFSF